MRVDIGPWFEDAKRSARHVRKRLENFYGLRAIPAITVVPVFPEIQAHGLPSLGREGEIDKVRLQAILPLRKQRFQLRADNQPVVLQILDPGEVRRVVECWLAAGEALAVDLEPEIGFHILLKRAS